MVGTSPDRSWDVVARVRIDTRSARSSRSKRRITDCGETQSLDQLGLIADFNWFVSVPAAPIQELLMPLPQGHVMAHDH